TLAPDGLPRAAGARLSLAGRPSTRNQTVGASLDALGGKEELRKLLAQRYIVLQQLRRPLLARQPLPDDLGGALLQGGLLGGEAAGAAGGGGGGATVEGVGGRRGRGNDRPPPPPSSRNHLAQRREPPLCSGLVRSRTIANASAQAAGRFGSSKPSSSGTTRCP